MDPMKHHACAVHDDYGSFTLLAPAGEGLEVRTPDGKKWIQVPVKKNHLVLNIGNFMSSGAAAIFAQRPTE